MNTLVLGLILGLGYAYAGMLVIILVDSKIGWMLEHFVDERVWRFCLVLTAWPIAAPGAAIAYLVRRRRAKTPYPDYNGW